ncbi:methyl-accepting chemotaxis protein [Aquabacterium sp. UBA2148]|uniref:methyl-accepting chemotaxis protein n=1 Tax=Aquabacterium sp. UBA2148 TaxID=1946042 RepID=UPI00257BC71B|nr:methyl-accepting chemotaxis protein [Aquabacterium sp. UBA2148]
MNQLSVKARLVGGFALLAFALLAVALTSLWLLRQSHHTFGRHVELVEAKTTLVDDIHSASGTRAIAARNMVLAANPQERAKAQQAAVKAHAEVQEAHRKLAQLNQQDQPSAQEARLLAELADIEKQYGAVALAIVDTAAKGQIAEATARMNQECMPLLARLDETINALGALSRSRSKDSVANSDAQAKTDAALLAVISVVAIAVSGYLAWSLPRTIIEPLNDAARLARAVAEGDLSQSIQSQRNDEIGRLLNSLDAMRSGLSDMVTRVRSGSDRIRSSSAEIASGNNDLSRRTEAQSSSLQQTAAAMEQMTASVQNSAQTATDVSAIAVEASESARHGGVLVGQVVATMNDITESSKRISEIIGTIDGIAFQTNILALNAAVEAARAGEQGKGFAVVAAEVRNLAQRSSEAAKQIRNLISDSVTRVGNGASLVGDAGVAMNDIVDKVEKVSDLIQAISNAASEQNDGIKQVNQAVSVLDQGTQQNAALVEQSAAAAESLKVQAQELAQVVDQFKVRGSHA